MQRAFVVLLMGIVAPVFLSGPVGAEKQNPGQQAILKRWTHVCLLTTLELGTAMGGTVGSYNAVLDIFTPESTSKAWEEWVRTSDIKIDLTEPSRPKRMSALNASRIFRNMGCIRFVDDLLKK